MPFWDFLHWDKQAHTGLAPVPIQPVRILSTAGA